MNLYEITLVWEEDVNGEPAEKRATRQVLASSHDALVQAAKDALAAVKPEATPRVVYTKLLYEDVIVGS